MAQSVTLNVKRYKLEVMPQNLIGSTDLGDNPKLVETAGFIPLPERIKQMVISGEQLAQSRDVFDSSDYREMYSDVGDNFLEYGDDIEEIQMKYQSVLAKQREILQRKGYIKPFEELAKSGESAAKTSEELVSSKDEKSEK